MSQFETVATLDELPEGKSKCVSLNGRTIAVFHQDGKFFAIDDLCPHMGASLSAGYVEQQMVTCPWHAWRFSICDGGWVENPKIKVDSFEVRVEGNQIQVALEPTPNEDEQQDGEVSEDLDD